MASSLLTGVMGLRVHQQMLDVVGNNLANANTPGFKAQRIRFSDLVYQTIKQATATGSDAVGGTNPKQIGLGVGVAAIDVSMQQGNLEATGQELDLAIQGSGFFVLESGGRTVYTRAGAFGIDKDNYLADLATGFRVQRFGTVGEPAPGVTGFQEAGDNRISIPIGTGSPGKVTETVTLRGNLSAEAIGPLAQVLTSSTPFLSGGSPATASTALNDLDSNLVDYVPGDQLRLQGTTSGGTPVDVTVNVPATVGDLLNVINANFPGSTATLDAAGNLVITADSTGPSQLSVVISDAAGNTGQTNWNVHKLLVTTNGKDGDTSKTSIQIFDSQGRAHALDLTFQKTGDNVWRLTGALPSGTGTLTDNLVEGITFNDNGSFQQVTGTGTGDITMTIQFPDLGTPQTIIFEMGQGGGFDGLTQFGGESSASAVAQDGHAAGALESVSIAKDGIVNGVFSNGQTLQLAQIAIAQFANPAGLSREGDNYLLHNAQSGPPLLGAATTGGRGFIEQGTLENSNVDVALEFTRLIIAQRGFQVNARTITVSDQVLQELANLIR